VAAVVHLNATASTLNQATYATTSFTPTVGDLLVFMSAVGATVDAGAATASNNGITFGTEITHAVRGGIDTQYAYVAGQLVPSSPTAMTCTMDVTGDNGTGAIDFVAAITGMSKVNSAAVRQSGTNNGAAGTTPSVTMGSAILTTNPVIAFMQNVSNPAGVTPPANFTELSDTGYPTPDKGAEYAHRNSGETGTTITWGGTSATAWSAIVIEFDASSNAVTGVGTASFGFTGTAAGQPTTFGVAAATFGFTGTAAGIDRAVGAAGGSFGFTGSASGVAGAPPVLGAGTGLFGFTGTANGIDRALGTALASLGFTGTALGVARPLGVGSGAFGFTGTAAGIDRAVGTAVAAFGFTGTASGTPEVFGMAVASLGFTGTAQGVAGSPPVTGVGVAAFGFTGTAAGTSTTLGVATASFGFTGAALGLPRVTGTAVALLGFTATADGDVRVYGVAAAALGFTAMGIGSNIPIPDLRNARCVYTTAEATVTITTASPRTTISTAEPEVEIT